jgi:outer membrane protein TolC
LDSYYRALLAETMVKVNERSLTRKQEVYDLLDRNFKAGSGAKAQSLAALADVKMQNTELITARQNAAAVKMMLNAMIGRPVAEEMVLDTAATLTSVADAAVPSDADAIAEALRNRGDLESLDYFRKANEGGVKIYKAMYLPTIAASGSVGIGGTDLKDMVDWDKRNWSIGAVMSWQFFDGFANSAKAAQYQSDVNKLDLAKSTIAKMLEIEIRSAIQECAAADTNINASQEAFAAASESYDLTSSNFAQGSGQLVDLQQSEERLRLAEMGKLSARYRYMKSRAALQVAMGKDIIKLEDK